MNEKKIGFWSWLFVLLKRLVVDLPKIVKKPLVEWFFGVLGVFFAPALYSLVSYFFIPFQICFLLVCLHGAYRSELFGF